MRAKNLNKSTVSRLASLALIFWMSFAGAWGCTPKTMVVTPPEALMQDCPQTPLPNGLMTTKSVEEYAVLASIAIVTLQADMATCNAKQAALRAWDKSVKEAK